MSSSSGNVSLAVSTKLASCAAAVSRLPASRRRPHVPGLPRERAHSCRVVVSRRRRSVRHCRSRTASLAIRVRPRGWRTASWSYLLFHPDDRCSSDYLNCDFTNIDFRIVSNGPGPHDRENSHGIDGGPTFYETQSREQRKVSRVLKVGPRHERSELTAVHTAGCKSVKNFATPGSRIS
jgi:hypothetical protein